MGSLSVKLHMFPPDIYKIFDEKNRDHKISLDGPFKEYEMLPVPLISL